MAKKAKKRRRGRIRTANSPASMRNEVVGQRRSCPACGKGYICENVLISQFRRGYNDCSSCRWTGHYWIGTQSNRVSKMEYTKAETDETLSLNRSRDREERTSHSEGSSTMATKKTAKKKAAKKSKKGATTKKKSKGASDNRKVDKNGKTMKAVVFELFGQNPEATLDVIIKLASKALPDREVKKSTINSWRYSWGKGYVPLGADATLVTGQKPKLKKTTAKKS